MAGGAAPKVEEPQAHPPKDQLPNVSFCITSPPPWRECCFLLIFSSSFQIEFHFQNISSILLNLVSFALLSCF